MDKKMEDDMETSATNIVLYRDDRENPGPRFLVYSC